MHDTSDNLVSAVGLLLMAGALAVSAGAWAAVDYPTLSDFNPQWSSANPGLTVTPNLPTAALLGNGSLGAVNGGDANHKFFMLTRGDLWGCGDMTKAAPISFGYLDILSGEKSVGTTDTLDIVSATLRTEGRLGRGNVKLESFVAADEDLFVVTGVSSADDEWTIRFTTNNQSSNAVAEAHAMADGFWVRRSTVNLAPKDPRSWTTNATAAVSAVGATLSAGAVIDSRSAAAKLKIAANRPFAIVVATDPARRFDASSLARIRAGHEAWWRAWWGRSRIALGDSELERFYYGQLYLLGSCVRQGKFPPGLYGIWPTTDEPSWRNDFHLNYNYMATYYGCFAANRCEVAETMPDPIIAYLPRALANAKKRLRSLEFNYNGRRMLNTKAYLDRRTDLANGIDDAALFPVAMGPWGLSAAGDTQHCGQISDGAFQCALMCTHWEYTLDRAYLKKVWPLFDKTANFFLKWCEKETLPNGGYRYVVYDSHWEGSGMAKNSVVALSSIRRLFATLADVTPVLRELGIDVPESKAAAWRDFAAHLSELPTGTASIRGVSRRMLSGVERANGKAELALCANAVNLESILPCDAFAFDITDEYRALATNTVNAMLSAAGDRIWINGYNQTPKLYAMAIRMGYPCRPIIEAFKKFEIRKRGQLNFHLRDDVHGVEKIGAMEFVNSMLIQSDCGFVKVFPNWTGADAKFERLRAKGAFVVSAEMKGGAVTRVEVVAEKGGTFRLVDPFCGRVMPKGAVRGKTRHSNEPTLEFAMKPGERICLQVPVSDGAPAGAYRFYRFKVDATAGDGLQLSEVKLFSGTTDVTRAAVQLHYDSTTRARPEFVFREGFEPEKAFDGDMNTKWYDDRADTVRTRDAVWVTLEYVQPIKLTHYEWYTADLTWKFTKRSPYNWRFQGSNDNATWTDLDAVSEARTTLKDYTLGYRRMLGSPKPIVTATSLVTRDGRRLVSCREGDATWQELVPMKELPDGLPSVREWKIYCIVSSHTDIGLDRSSYWKRHGAVQYVDRARELVKADPNDADPAAYRYTIEGAWFFDNYPMEKGEETTRQFVGDAMARNRIGTSALCAGNITEAYGFEQMCRSTYARKRFEERWGLKPKTMIMGDNPGLSWGLVQPCVEAGVENLVFLPNQWNPLPSTIWPRDKTKANPFHDPDGGGGGSRVDVSWKSSLPLVFWWEAADRSTKMLVWAPGHYGMAATPFGIGRGYAKLGNLSTMERALPAQLAKMEKRYPFDIWLTSHYADFEKPNTTVSDLLKQWNAKWRWPEMHTVASPDEPFDLLRAKWGDKIATLRGDMASGWVQFLHSMPECLARKVNVDRDLAAAEAEASVAAVTKGAPYPAEDFARAWWGLVMNDEHSYATPLEYQGRRIFETIRQHYDWVEKAERVASGKCKMENVKWFEEADRRAHSQAPVLCSGSNARTLENRWYRVAHTDGVITSIYDKELGLELLNAPANDLRYTCDNHKTWEKDAAAALGAEVTQSVRLDPDEKRIWVETEIRHAKNLRCRSKDRYKRYGYLAFPFDVPGGTFYAQLNGPVMRPYLDLTGHTSDAYVGARDWVGVENGVFGVALVQFDTLLVEFGEIHPDKTCYTGKPPTGKTTIYPALFNDWLVEHKPDGASFNFRFRYAITSYKGTWQAAHIPAFAARTVNPRLAAVSAAHVKADQPGVVLCGLKAAEDGNGLIARFRETEGRETTAKIWQNLLPGAKVARNTILEKPWTDGSADVLALKPYQYATVRIANGKKIPFAPSDDSAFKYTGLISHPKAIHGERLGQIYMEWGLDPSPDFDHWELYRGETADFPKDAAHFVANVKPDVVKGLAFAVNRYDDRGLKTHTRYHYAIRTVHKNGAKGSFHAFSALTRDTPEGVITKHGEADR